jgi:hypothetical protein
MQIDRRSFLASLGSDIPLGASMNRLTALVILCISLTYSCTGRAQTSTVLVSEHANVIDGLSAEPLRDVTVVVRDGKLENVGSAPPSLPDSVQHVDITGHWMLPGLIDAHVHPLTLQGAQNMLKAGVTTGRSMFTQHYMDVGLRELHRRGDADIPDILAAGYPVVPIPTQFRPDMTGMFLDMPELDDLRKDSDLGVEGVRRLVRANLDHHVDVIKLFATDRAGVPTSDPRRRMLFPVAEYEGF